MPIITTTTAGYSVKEIQYGGGKKHHGPGNRGFYITPPAGSPIVASYEYPLYPSPHHDTNYSDGDSDEKKIFMRLLVMQLLPQLSLLFLLLGNQISHLLGRVHHIQRMDFRIAHHN